MIGLEINRSIYRRLCRTGFDNNCKRVSIYSEAQIPREEPMCLCFHGIWHRSASPLFCKMDLSSSWNESKKKKKTKKKKRSFQYKASRLKMVEESLSCLKFSCFQRGWWVCFFYTTAIFQIFIHQYFYQYY